MNTTVVWIVSAIIVLAAVGFGGNAAYTAIAVTAINLNTGTSSLYATGLRNTVGLTFIPEEGWPNDMGNDLLVTYHGSWNRSTPTGYKVVRFHLDAARNAVGGPVDFMTGFLGGGQKPDDALGRPVSLLALPGGVLYVSDDRAGAVYQVTVKR